MGPGWPARVSCEVSCELRLHGDLQQALIPPQNGLPADAERSDWGIRKAWVWGSVERVQPPHQPAPRPGGHRGHLQTPGAALITSDARSAGVPRSEGTSRHSPAPFRGGVQALDQTRGPLSPVLKNTRQGVGSGSPGRGREAQVEGGQGAGRGGSGQRAGRLRPARVRRPAPRPAQLRELPAPPGGGRGRGGHLGLPRWRPLPNVPSERGAVSTFHLSSAGRSPGTPAFQLGKLRLRKAPCPEPSSRRECQGLGGA